MFALKVARTQKTAVDFPFTRDETRALLTFLVPAIILCSPALSDAQHTYNITCTTRSLVHTYIYTRKPTPS